MEYEEKKVELIIKASERCRANLLLKRKHAEEVKIALAPKGCFAGFSRKNKNFLEACLGEWKKWKIQFLAFCQDRAPLSGFTEKNKMSIVSAIDDALQCYRITEDQAEKMILYFGHGAEGETWTEDEKVEVIEDGCKSEELRREEQIKKEMSELIIRIAMRAVEKSKEGHELSKQMDSSRMENID